MANEQVKFISAANFPVVADPYSATVADFNGDGNADLAVNNYGTANVSVLLGNGKGGFSPVTNFTVGANPFTIVTADFNGDGSADLVTSGYKDGKISLLLGNGKGSFGTAIDFAVGAKLIDVAIGDFNGDGKPDLAIADDSANLAVLIGDGKGGFGTPIKLAAGTTPISIAVGDANGDGKSDLIAANSASTGLSVLFGDGEGGFGTVGDFNNDNRLDLVSVNRGSNDTSVLLNDTIFTASTTPPPVTPPVIVTPPVVVAPPVIGAPPVVTDPPVLVTPSIVINPPANSGGKPDAGAAGANSGGGLIGSKSQTAPEGRTIDLTDFAGKALKADITTQGSAAYTNNVGFYLVEDAIGSIKLADGSFVKPGDANYAAEAVRGALVNSLRAGKIDNQTNLDITGGKIYAPVVVAQGSLDDFIAKNSNNSGGANSIHAYFNYSGANPDKIDHFRLQGNNVFAVEDQYGGGDKDFNDLVVTMNVRTV